MLGLSPQPRQVVFWRVFFNGRCVPYFEAIQRGGTKATSIVRKRHYPTLDQKLQYEKAPGWDVGKVIIYLNLGEIILWDGHLWRAGGVLDDGEVVNAAWWARLMPGRKEREGPSVYAVDCIDVAKPAKKK